MTSRPYRFIYEFDDLKAYEEFRVSPINWRQAGKIVRKITKAKKVPQAKAREFIRTLEKIHGFELNPLLVTVFAATTDYTKQDIPANITELFKKFTELMLGRWDEKKGLRQQYQTPLKDFVLTRLAYRMHSSRSVSIAKSDAIEIVRDELIRRGHEGDVSKLLDEIFERSGIFRLMDNDIEFRHHLLQEFFAGRGIPDTDTVYQLIQDDWWKRALIFHFGEKADNINLLAAAAKHNQGGDPERTIVTATTVGLALQACYLSPVEDKLEVWKWVVEALSISQEGAIKLVNVGGKFPISSFFNYYLYCRDSVALSHLRSNLDELMAWVNDTRLPDEAAQERHMYWLIIGLIESGEIRMAEALVKKFRPRDQELLTAIFLGCHLAKEIRPLSEDEKISAKNICSSLQPKVVHQLALVLKEWGSLLTELRNGELTAIEAQDEPDE